VTHTFAHEFLLHAGAGSKALSATPNLEEQLALAFQKGRAAWPSVAVVARAFIAHLARHVGGARDPVQALATIHVTDLYLACGCAQGDAAALRAFEDHFLGQATRLLMRVDSLPSFSEEVRQRVRERIFVAGPDALPRIATYSGRGPLAAWVRMATTRQAINLRQAQHGQRPAAEPLDAEGDSVLETDPELEYLKAKYGPQIRAAFVTTLAELSTREAAIVRLFFLEGMSADAIGRSFQVSARTVQRWLSQCREEILLRTRQQLKAQLKSDTGEVNSLMRVVGQDIDTTIARHLAPSAAGPKTDNRGTRGRRRP
jgi:RNA polymerase sigma-70 factor (ECF subfamily)